MKAATDTYFWKQLLNVPGAERGAWITSDDPAWSITELGNLFGSAPPEMTVYIWKFSGPTHPVTPIMQQQRSFFFTSEIWSRIVYSSNVVFLGRNLWFDLATLDRTCAADLLNYVRRGQFGMATGLVIEKKERAEKEIGTAVSSAILRAWNHQNRYHRAFEWKKETWQQIHRWLPGAIYTAADMNCRRYFVTLSEPAISWLLARSTGHLDLKALSSLEVEIDTPKAVF